MLQPDKAIVYKQYSQGGRLDGQRKEHHMKLFKTPKEMYTAAAVAGGNKAAKSVVGVLLSAFLAGTLLSFGGHLSTIVGGSLGASVSAGIKKSVFAAVFPIGLWLIVLTGTDLLTGNILFVTMAFLEKKASFARLLLNWAIVFIGNFLGSAFFVLFFSYLTGTFKGEALDYAVALAEAKLALGWGEVFLRGVAANWLVTLALIGAVSSEDNVSKIVVMWLPIYTFIASGFEHSIANMYFVTNGLVLGADSHFGWELWQSIIPSTLGNIVGGALLHGAICWYIYMYTPPGLEVVVVAPEHPDEQMSAAVSGAGSGVDDKARVDNKPSIDDEKSSSKQQQRKRKKKLSV